MVTQDTDPAPAADVAAVLTLSDERELWLRRELAAEIRGYERGHLVGYAAGYLDGRQAEAAERDTFWRSVRELTLSLADPGGPEARESVNRRLMAAMSFERREAWRHWHERWTELRALSRDQAYVRQARSVQSWKRSYEQNVAIVLSEGGSGRGEAA